MYDKDRALALARMRLSHLLPALGLALCITSGSPAAAAPPGASDVTLVQAPGAGRADNWRQRQMAFLQRLRQSDPRYETIDRAVFNAQNEFGFKLKHNRFLAILPARRKQR